MIKGDDLLHFIFYKEFCITINGKVTKFAISVFSPDVQFSMANLNTEIKAPF